MVHVTIIHTDIGILAVGVCRST